MPRRGVCEFCGNEKSLNAKGLCASCKNVQPCAVHEEILTAQRCIACKKASCAYCILQGRCTECREKDAEALKERRARGHQVVEEDTGGGKGRLVLLFGLLVVVGAGGLYGYRWLNKPEPINQDMACQTRVKMVQQAIQTYFQKKHKVPTSIADIVAFAQESKEIGELGAPIVPHDARPIPSAVVYTFDGARYVLQATTDKGVPYVKKDGKPLELVAP